MIFLIKYIFKFICYLIYLYGLWLLTSPLIIKSLKLNKFRKSRFRNANSSSKQEFKNKLLIHLKMLLAVTINKNSNNDVFSFIAISLSIMIINLLLYISILGFSPFVFLSSLLFGLLPYIFLLLKLFNKRKMGSYEGQSLLSELINQYKINNLNIIEAIDCAIPQLKKQIYSRRALFKLSVKIKDFSSNEELSLAIKEFIFYFNTEWSILLGMNIFIALSDGTDITESLDDIINEFSYIKTNVEANKRNNNESFLMIKFITPLAYIASVYALFQINGFTLNKYFKYQFFNPIGLKMAVVIFVLIFFNFIFVSLLSKPKYDF